MVFLRCFFVEKYVIIIFNMEEKIAKIKEWLGAGSINIFGLPMSGKDTVGVKLAESLSARFLSSGMIIRAMEAETRNHMSDQGNLIPSDVFFKWVLPYFDRDDLKGLPLVLSSVGRWAGEEDSVIDAAASADHPIKAVVLLNISEADVEKRWQTAHAAGRRLNAGPQEVRKDDTKIEIFRQRLNEFRVKTLPVVKHYQELGILLPVNADAPRETVMNSVVDALYNFATHQPDED